MNTRSSRFLCGISLLALCLLLPLVSCSPHSPGTTQDRAPALGVQESQAIEHAPIWPMEPAYRILQVDTPPSLDLGEAFASGVWESAELMTPFYRQGVPEPPKRRTTLRFLRYKGSLYIIAECLEPDITTLTPGADDTDIWQDDSIELLLAEESDRSYPYLHLLINAAGALVADRTISGRHIEWQAYPQPGSAGDYPAAVVPVDTSSITVRTAVGKDNWRLGLVLPLAKHNLPDKTLYGNVVRNRPADRSEYAWVDLWKGLDRLRYPTNMPHRFNPLTVVNRPARPRPRIKPSCSLAIGVNNILLEHWRDGYTFFVDGKAIVVDPGGKAIVPIGRHGTARLKIQAPDGSQAVQYAAEVRRGLILTVTEPFQDDVSKPIRLRIALNTTAGTSTRATLTARRQGKIVGKGVAHLRAGVHTLDLPHSPVTGEVEIEATALIGEDQSKPIRISALRACVLGVGKVAYDRFRPGIEKLPTRAMYRAGLADAINYYRFIPSGGMAYPLAVVYKSAWPENPYKGDKRFLNEARARMEEALDPANWHKMLERPPAWYVQPYLLTYELLKDDIPPQQAAYWRRRLLKLSEELARIWITPALDNKTFYTRDVGTGTNVFSHYLSSVYTAGVVFDRPEWRRYGRKLMRGLARHAENGQFAEREGISATAYTWTTMSAVGHYYFRSRDKQVLPALLDCVRFGCQTSLPDGFKICLHDGRQNYYMLPMIGEGDFVLSLTPQGRRLARVRLLHVINPDRRPSQAGPGFWSGAADIANYFMPGDERDWPQEKEFYFLKNKALIARQQGFIYGMSAVSLEPIIDKYVLDPQNAIEIHHAKAGPILWGNNSQQHPTGGSFMRKLKDQTEFLPADGKIQSAANGHDVLLTYKSFSVKLSCKVTGPKAAKVIVELISAEGDEPVVYSFFPGVRRSSDIQVRKGNSTLRFNSVLLECSRPVEIQKDNKLFNPYKLRFENNYKPVRAYVTLKKSEAFEIRVSVLD